MYEIETGCLFGATRLGGNSHSVLAFDAKQRHIKPGNHHTVF